MGRGRPQMVIDEELFREQWMDLVPVRTMAVNFGCSVSQVSVLSQRLGLPKRKRGLAQDFEEPVVELTGGHWQTNGRVQVWVPA